ncbi:hypothetical protein SDC9_165204 [bioreactor metagenome]|jgi:hypothetical protein|uniref:DUF2997 domain-containing protein n=1 Tax=bioreactor metagenome TaxID=1076179 RepID=A0A645FWA3_9ZZZZ
MPQREFEVVISSDGTVEVLVKGYKGKGCLEAVKMFEKIVGELRQEQKTGEFYEPDEVVRYQIDQRH